MEVEGVSRDRVPLVAPHGQISRKVSPLRTCLLSLCAACFVLENRPSALQ